ncbi:MAG: hypothetical protein GXY55_19420 [Phycisphaerae bacterium]|nr:hypothetical protein [Phycisphaerae bacterium]
MTHRDPTTQTKPTTLIEPTTQVEPTKLIEPTTQVVGFPRPSYCPW